MNDQSTHSESAFRYSVVVPVYNEHEVIAGFCAKAKVGLPPGYELLICYDFEGDSTLPALAAIPADQKPEHIRLVHNTLGKGVRYAIEAGMRAATAPVTLVMMADMSDDPSCVEAMISRVEAGADVVCGSRYMKGGQQIGGPWFKKFLSRSAGVSLHYLTGLPTHDPTNSFKAYRTEYLRRATIESKEGFCLGLELTAKAYFAGGRVEEVPSTWTDRSGGESRFRLGKWLPLYLDWYAWTLDKSRRANILFPAALFAFALILGVIQLTVRPDMYQHAQYIIGEQGNQLWRADEILQGKIIQRDFATPYGPLGIYLYAGAAAVFGNTPLVCHCWNYALNLCCLMLAFLLLRRVADLLTAFLYSLAVLTTVFIPNYSMCVGTYAEYLPIERAEMLGLALLWQPPDRRSLPRNFILGLILGLMQWDKFGVASFNLAAILLLDLIWWLKHGDIRANMFSRGSISNYAFIFAGGAILELVFVALSFAILPRNVAIDTVWPAYMATEYDSFTNNNFLWKKVIPDNFNRFLGWLLIPFLSLLMGLISFFRYLLKPANRTNDRGIAIFLNLLFFVIALQTYIVHHIHFYGFLFGPSLAGIWLYRRQTWWFRIAFLALVIPFFASKIIAIMRPPAQDMEWFEVEKGQWLFLSKPLIRDLERISKNQPKDQTKFLLLVGYWSGGGFHHYYNKQYPLRNVFIVKAGFRPYDIEELMHSIDRIYGVMVDTSSRDPSVSLENVLLPILGEASARELASKFEDKPDSASGFYLYYARK